MPQNPQKTKGEILLELESIKGLLIEEDDIPILQEVDEHDSDSIDSLTFQSVTFQSLTGEPQASLPGGTQTSIFDVLTEDIPDLSNSRVSNNQRPIPKATGENPFLPQHIRDRLQGNNPTPIFDFDMNLKMNNTTSHKYHTENRHDLVNELVKRHLPQIEQELRLKLLAMTEEELKKL